MNTVLIGRSALAAEDLLAIGKALEHAAGRRPGPRLGPRLLDIDLLFWGDRRSELPELSLPHPRMFERRFVLEPLAEIAPDLSIGPDDETIAGHPLRMANTESLTRIAWRPRGTAPSSRLLKLL